MKLRQILLVLVAILAILGLYFVYALFIAFPKEWAGDGNTLDLSKLEPGDIIVCKGCTGAMISPFMSLFGEWHHASMFIGNGKMIEAWVDGVRVVSVDMVKNANSVAVYRVNANDSVKQKAIEWALSKLNLPYDFKWITFVGGKEIEGDSYYCSELIWASYLTSEGPDLDNTPGWSWKYGKSVSPDDLVNDNDVRLIEYSD
ncbi:MAG: YiiX/YebB-like N1pC/P60 family cysteine hydrolase [Archaeoglobaceae archaeon]|nr:YiiX/YebB-like N1pC/P60 family cysteine hydrolase [Archaeoglobaceae archaeon]MDW8117771.1 YiiX/YebB-like N1pC/P60 family cysteine hydrolase [Archaeoglobaceae archaeon]